MFATRYSATILTSLIFICHQLLWSILNDPVHSATGASIPPETMKQVPCPSLLSPSFPYSHPFPHAFPGAFPLNPARGSRERCKLPQWGLARSPNLRRFWGILGLKKNAFGNKTERSNYVLRNLLF